MSQYAVIYLTHGKECKVDWCDVRFLKKFSWSTTSTTKETSKTKSTKYYARANRGYGTALMHDKLMKPPNGFHVHHINGDGLDNRRCNLVVVDPTKHKSMHPRKTKGGFK